MDSWAGESVPGLARVDLAVEQMSQSCEQVRGMTVDRYLTEYFLENAVHDWVAPGEDRYKFREAVCLAWNAKQDRIRREREQ